MSAVRRQPDTRTIPELIAGQKPGYALDQRFYTDPDIYELELEKIVCRNWILAGHESELPNPNSASNLLMVSGAM
jgi:Rieske 2Fe-2S family protein